MDPTLSNLNENKMVFFFLYKGYSQVWPYLAYNFIAFDFFQVSVCVFVWRDLKDFEKIIIVKLFMIFDQFLSQFLFFFFTFTRIITATNVHFLTGGRQFFRWFTSQVYLSKNHGKTCTNFSRRTFRIIILEIGWSNDGQKKKKESFDPWPTRELKIRLMKNIRIERNSKDSKGNRGKNRHVLTGFWHPFIDERFVWNKLRVENFNSIKIRFRID